MHEAVDDVIARRRVDPAGLRRAMSASTTVHFSIVLLLFVVPKDWFVKDQTKPLMMTISLGGSPGERSGGMVSAGARPIEKIAPPPKRPEPIPPATPPKPSNIVVPMKTPTKTPPPKPTDNLTPSPLTRPPTTGAQVTKGTAVAETGARGQDTGLQSGGGVSGALVKVDSDFCCPEYIAEIQRRIMVRWRSVQPDSGETIVVFEILKDGSFTAPTFEKKSGFVTLDIASMDAFVGLRLPPLPAPYQADRLKVHLSFPYKR